MVVAWTDPRSIWADWVPPTGVFNWETIPSRGSSNQRWSPNSTHFWLCIYLLCKYTIIWHTAWQSAPSTPALAKGLGKLLLQKVLGLFLLVEGSAAEWYTKALNLFHTRLHLHTQSWHFARPMVVYNLASCGSLFRSYHLLYLLLFITMFKLLHCINGTFQHYRVNNDKS